MGFREIFWMTKPKIALLVILLVAFIPSYYNSNCPVANCVKDAAGLPCKCGFSPFDFYTMFILSYLFASVIVEVYNFIRKRPAKNK